MMELVLKPTKLTPSCLNKIYKLRDAFVRAFRGFDLYDYQRGPSNDIIESVLNGDGTTILIEYARQSGKTEEVALTISFLLLYYKPLMREYRNIMVEDFQVGLFAPLQEQAKTAFDKIKLIMNNEDVKKETDVFFNEANGNTVKLMNGTTCYCFSASPTSHTESKTMHLIIIDEAQLVDDGKIENTILPMGTNTNATVVYIGTAGYKKCKFYDLLTKGMVGHRKYIYNFKEIIRQKITRYYLTKNELELNYYKYVKSELGKVGIKIKNPQEMFDLDIKTIDSDAIKTQYALQWMLEKGQFITIEKLKLLEGEHEIRREEKIKNCYAGLDFGKMHDSTVLIIGDDEGNILFWLELLGEDYESQFHIILRVLQNFKIVSLCCDASGNQDQMVDRFRKVMQPVGVRVTGVNFSTTKSDMYKNLDFFMRAVYNEDGEKISDARIRYPKTECIEKEKFILQLVDLQKEIDKNGKWNCAHPEGDSYHDDYPDSLALYAWNFTYYTPLFTNIKAPGPITIEGAQKVIEDAQKNMTWADKLKSMKKIGEPAKIGDRLQYE